MPHLEQHGSWLKSAGKIILPCAALIIVVGAVLALEQASSAPEQVKSPGDQFNSTMAQADALERQKKYNEGEQLLQKYVQTNPPGQYQYQALMKAGNLAFDQRKAADAVKYYKQAVAADSGKLTSIDAQSIAMAATAAGDKATAIEYYRQAIKLTNVQPGMGNNIDEFKAAIVHLGGTP